MPIDADNGEKQPDPERPDGETPEHRQAGARIQRHNRPITAPVEPDETTPEPR